MQMTPDAEILAMITSILVTILVVAGILSLVTYIFSSLGFYTLAKRRASCIRAWPGCRMRHPVDPGEPVGPVREPDRRQADLPGTDRLLRQQRQGQFFQQFLEQQFLEQQFLKQLRRRLYRYHPL